MTVARLCALAPLLSLVAALVACGESAGEGEAVAAPRDAELTVAAAADLRYAFDEIGAAFTKETGIPVVFSFGSSGQLAAQVVNGAPFDAFASANVEYVDEVIRAGRGDPETKQTYAFGRIVIWSKETVYPDLAALRDPAIRTIAIANPEHAPYGLAAKQALEAAGVYRAVEPRLVYGENVSDTLRLADSGNADVAIVALSLATVSDGKWTLVPAELHEPLEQALVVTAPAERAEAAQWFVAFVSSPVGREVMRRYGFLLPGEEPAG